MIDSLMTELPRERPAAEIGVRADSGLADRPRAGGGAQHTRSVMFSGSGYGIYDLRKLIGGG